MNPNRLYSFATAAIAAVTLAVSAHADLLSGNEAQLETWLGQGDQDFTNIFTKQVGDDSLDFHAAVDGKGATFTLFNAYTYNYETQLYDIGHLLGGYDPLSWDSGTGFHYSLLDSDRTAFIFDFTSYTIQRQNLAAEGNPGSGYYQTHNLSVEGAVFGGGDVGYDLRINGSLNDGDAHNWAYGGSSLFVNIVGGIFTTDFRVAEIEVYTVAPAASRVPDIAGTLGLLSISMLGLMGFRCRFAGR